MVHYSKHDVMGAVDAKCTECHNKPQFEYFACNVCGAILCGNCLKNARVCKGCGKNISRTTSGEVQQQPQQQPGQQQAGQQNKQRRVTK